MPSLLHEALVDMFRERPQLGAELLAVARGRPTTAADTAETLSIDLSRARPTEARADAVLRLHGAEELVLIVEVQLRPDGRKRRVWPLYVASAHHRHRVPVALLVLTLSARTAAWASTPIVYGPGASLTPLVIGPAEVPIITSEQDAVAAPELAVLSAMAHGRGAEALAIGIAATEAARRLDDGATRLYLDLVCAHLHPIARHALEAIMVKRWEPQSDFFKRLIAEGRNEGRAIGMQEGIEKGIETGFSRGIEKGIETGFSRGIEKGIETGFSRGIEKGIEKGIEQGRARGLLDGQRSVLARQLCRRFGPLPASAEAKLASAGPEALERWTDRILFANTLDEVLGT